MVKGRKKDDVLYRSVKFEIHPTEDQQRILWQISGILQDTWNRAVQERHGVYETNLKPIYDQIAAARKEAEAEGYKIWELNMRKVASKKLRELGIPVRVVSRREALLLQLADAFKEHAITLFDQINGLTPLRTNNQAYKMVPRNWQEETLDTVNAGFTSFMALRRNGDPDARPPRLRDREEFFCEIPGRYGFKVVDENFVLRYGSLNTTAWTFPIPEYQKEQISRWKAVKKFTLFRDEKERAKPGRFWVALAGEMKKPNIRKPNRKALIFLAPGATAIGICYSQGSFAIKLWRPDQHWKPRIDAVEERLKSVTKGSRKYEGLLKARRTMFRILSRQQKQNHREIVSRLMKLGIHFVVSDLVIRSKVGKLADSGNPERGGTLGLNWMAQNTGGIAELIAHLEDKVKEFGGSVQRFKPTSTPPPYAVGEQHKLLMAQRLKEDYLRSL